MKKISRAIIVEDNGSGKELITIKRTMYDKEGNISKQYYTLPGGHVENDENFEMTVIREVEEELGILVSSSKEIAHIYLEDMDREEKFYQCKYISGELGTGKGDEFSNPDIDKYGKYEVEKLRINNLDRYNLLPCKIKDIIIDKYTI